MLPWKLRKCQILPVNQNLSSIYFPLAKFQLVSSNPSLAIIWQMTYTQKLPKLCSATLIAYPAVLLYRHSTQIIMKQMIQIEHNRITNPNGREAAPVGYLQAWPRI